MATSTINLTPSESLVRKCLLDCRNTMKDAVPGMADLELRFAGGWVRDKLLGRPSHDIDVALSTMTGEQFGEALLKFMSVHEQRYLDEARTQGIPARIKGLHKILKNPDRSKHLETVTTTMFGLDLDFVNLRKEVYDEVSRNPRMEFGEPEEDAFRRDATVNALFYHLDKQEVEDFTKRGLDDMKSRIMRTPLEPYQTFKDDPLRVLRIIRFACRLDYQIESSAYEAMKDQRIHQALRMKISRERVGTEVGKIMAGPDPLTGLNYIFDRNLFGVVFANPSSEAYPDAGYIPVIYEGLQRILDDASDICLDLHLKDDPSLSWFLATYVPWHNFGSDAVLAARESIKATNMLTKILGDAIKNQTALHQAAELADSGRATRSVVGITLRNAGSSWRAQVLWTLLCELSTGQLYTTVIARYRAFLKYIRAQNLTEADKLKSIIDGNEIKTAMQLTRAGPWLKYAIDDVIEWQFANPAGTVQDAKEMIASRREKFQAD